LQLNKESTAKTNADSTKQYDTVYCNSVWATQNSRIKFKTFVKIKKYMALMD